MTVKKKIGTFNILKEIEIPEIQCTLRQLEEERTHAKVLHIEADDPENAFCLSFQTLPDSSDGVAHILEHTVLCGSKRFPVKDSFFLMNRRSLNTFMNAFTGSDFTCYPAASLVEKDFYNLLDVYLDAVFQPNLNRLSFLQEGHRLEFENPSDEKSPLLYKGVVYNEMKGALSSGARRLDEEMSKHLFPGLPYQYNSGGEPKDIPNLTYEAFVDFHKKYYHPSRCLFYLYGNMPLEKYLNFIYEKVLKEAPVAEPLPKLPNGIRLKAPKMVEFGYPITAEEDLSDKCYISFSWLTTPVVDQLSALALSVLLVALVDTDASPLKRALLDTKLCKQVSASIDTEVSEVPISIVFRGCEKNSVEPLKEALFSTLKKLAKEPLSPELIDSSLHQIELQRQEITGDQLPYGLNLFLRAALLEHHGGKPEEALKIHSLFHDLRDNLKKDPLYFNHLMEKWLINNSHLVTILCYPDQELLAKEEQEEKAALEKIKASLKPEEIKKIIDDSTALASFQESEDSQKLIDMLPKVTVKDIPKKIRDYPLQIHSEKTVDVYCHQNFTNDFLYADVAFNLPPLKLEELPYLRLFATLLTQLGTKQKSYETMLQEMQSYTGGIQSSLSISQLVDNYNLCKPQIQIQGKALKRNSQKLLSLMYQYITEPHFFDKERVKEIILKQYSGIVSNLSNQGLSYAASLAAKGHSMPNLVADNLFGLGYFWKLKEWVDNIDSQIKPLMQSCDALVEKILRTKPDLILSCSKEQHKELVKHHFYGIGGFEQKPIVPFSINEPLPRIESQGRITSASVANCFKLVPAPTLLDPNASYLSLASHILDNQTLHKEIREKGGAYGAGSSNKARGAYFSFYSYRDPQIAKTLKSFDRAVEVLINKGIRQSDLDEAKLEMAQEQVPISPGSRASTAYQWHHVGKTLALRQRFHDQMLKATPELVLEAVKKVLDPKSSEGTIVVTGSKELLEKNNQLLKKSGRDPLPLFSMEKEGA